MNDNNLISDIDIISQVDIVFPVNVIVLRVITTQILSNNSIK